MKESQRLWIGFAFIALFNIYSVLSASSSSSNQWMVYDSHHSPCIIMEATIDLNLTYLIGDPDISNSAGVHVPSGLTVNNDLSSCSTKITLDKTIDSQVLHLDFPKNSSWDGWSIEFYFTTDNQDFQASKSEFALYGVKIVANYSSQESIFPGHKDLTHTYTQSIDFHDPFPSVIAENIYANKHYSYFCNSPAQYPINSVDNRGLKAWITLRKIRVQAYAPAGTTKFGDREICPQDQTSDDLIPVIVGGVLSGLVVLTLIIYLVYRARQPPSVLYLTNPHSHFEDIGANLKHGNHHGTNEEEEDEESVKSERRIARHLQHHANYGFEE